MHELSVCQGLMRQVENVAQQNGAESVDRILLRVGQLSGVEASLLKHAFAPSESPAVPAVPRSAGPAGRSLPVILSMISKSSALTSLTKAMHCR